MTYPKKLENAIMLATLRRSLVYVEVQGATRLHKFVICKDIPIPYSMFCKYVILYGNHPYLIMLDSSVSEFRKLQDTWDDVGFVNKNKEFERTEQIVNLVVGVAIGMDNAPSESVDNVTNTDILPILRDVHEQMKSPMAG